MYAGEEPGTAGTCESECGLCVGVWDSGVGLECVQAADEREVMSKLIRVRGNRRGEDSREIV